METTATGQVCVDCGRRRCCCLSGIELEAAVAERFHMFEGESFPGEGLRPVPGVGDLEIYSPASMADAGMDWRSAARKAKGVAC